ncbi:hypothetical protein [Geomobilimonas luticola]|uniref:Uncharacterized protein n=1 Tax=Geomobilimonas luticola TaxID=1114878 RepID=A0ABS5S7U6_9BACT|nr:hypothetical protein [Geomobilimonas luticola]MBT0651443.1 hypothetical protein [Geomobilimonas luticola]
MADVLVNVAVSGAEGGLFSLQPLIRREEAAAEAGTGAPSCEEQDISTACYLCHGQCANFGVHGKGVRPCARGVTDIISRRREARQLARSERQGKS